MMKPERKKELREKFGGSVEELLDALDEAEKKFSEVSDLASDRGWRMAKAEARVDELQAERDAALARANKAAELAAITHGHNVKMHGERAELRARIAKLEAALREIVAANTSRHGPDASDLQDIARAALAGKGTT